MYSKTGIHQVTGKFKKPQRYIYIKSWKTAWREKVKQLLKFLQIFLFFKKLVKSIHSCRYNVLWSWVTSRLYLAVRYLCISFAIWLCNCFRTGNLNQILPMHYFQQLHDFWIWTPHFQYRSHAELLIVSLHSLFVEDTLSDTRNSTQITVFSHMSRHNWLSINDQCPDIYLARSCPG